MNELLLATSNPGKIEEFKAILSPIHCIPQNTFHIESADETGLSFIENAIIKARHASRLANMPALADDSGLVVLALNGEPGIYSARYAGINATDNDNIELVLNRLAHAKEQQRDAYFYCALALVQHAEDPAPLVATGKLVGEICKARQGKHGFGYDSIFYLANYNCTVAQLPPNLKNTLSHRALALKHLHSMMKHSDC